VSPALLATLAGCVTAPSETWLDRREASGPCFEVNLVDGLSEESTDELHALYACLNQTGNLEPLGGLLAALELDTRAGQPAALELAALANRAMDFGVDLLSVAGDIAAWLTDEDSGLDDVIALSLELVYGRPWPEIEGGEVALNDADALEAGLLVPALPLAQRGAAVLLDEELAPLEPLREAASSDEAVRALHTAAAILESEALAPTVAQLPANLGDAILRARSPENDLWTAAGGDSIRDLVDALLLDNGGAALSALAEPLGPVLSDTETRGRFRAGFEDLEAGGNLEDLPPQLVYLVEVDAWGAPVYAGGDSALYALLRMLASADDELRCSIEIDILPGDWGSLELFEVTVDNLAEALLRLIATRSTDEIVGGVDFLGEVLGLGLTEDVLYAVADAGTCDLIDRQMVDDLHALDRFNDPEAPDLLPLLLEVLGAFYDPDGSSDRIPELVDLIGAVHRWELTRPLEEVLRDLGEAPIVADLFALIPVLLEPGDHLDEGGLPSGVTPLDFEAVWEILEGLVDGEALAPLEPLVTTLLGMEEAWSVMGNLAALLQEEDARVAALEGWVLALAEADPLLESTREGLDAALAPETASPLLRIAELEPVLDAAAETAPDDEGPLPFYARLVVGGTLDELLRLLDGLLEIAGGE
jgi:hypothetical protein